MEDKFPLLIPEHLAVKLRYMGLELDQILWQQATDFLREKYGTHIIVHPHEVHDGSFGPVIRYDWTLISPFGADFEKEETFGGYYAALEDGIQEAINCIEEGPGKEPPPEEPGPIRKLLTRISRFFETEEGDAAA